MTGTWIWFVSDATGVVTLLIFTSVVLLGATTAAPPQMSPAMALTVTVLHRSLSAVALAFLTLHVATAVFDAYVDISPLAVVVPFASSYQRIPIAFGSVAVDLLVAVAISSIIRQRVPEHWWRRVHWAAYAAAVVGVGHALLIGGPGASLTTSVSIGCAVLMGCAVLWRLVRLAPDRRRRNLARTGEWR